MLVRIRLFAVLRERAGARHVDVELPAGARVADALAAVASLTADVPVVLAVNRRYADADTVLAPDDELALIPPVSGGAGPHEAPSTLHARIVDGPLSLDGVAALVRDPRAGAVVTFSGVTRDVAFLDYEAYREMAQAELEAIVAEVAAAHALCAAAAEHRLGRVALGEPSVVVAASAQHRPAAFAGARALIDAIKVRVPIWKREEGSWVDGVTPVVGAAAATASAPTDVVDVALGEARLATGDAVRVAAADGTTRTARVTWLGGRFHQLRLDAPLVLLVGDTVLVRDAGGTDWPGRVLDVEAARHGPSRETTDRLAGLERRLAG